MYSAHLSMSPSDQVNALLSSPSNYTLLHTALVQAMLSPLVAWLENYVGGTPGSTSCSPGSATTTTTSSSSQSVMISNYSFMPSSITVPTGTTVTWTNGDNVAHTVTSSDGGPLNSPNIPPGQTYSYTFNAPGTYNYYCSIHPNMTGQVTVQ
jgi:plastocyanin